MSTIAHFVRVWLRPTETFIWGPIAHHTRHQPLVLAREAMTGAPAGDVELHLATRALRGSTRAWADLHYGAYRGLVAAERRFYTRTLQQRECALVHAQYATDARYVLPAVRDAGLPLVVTVHGYDYSRFPQSYGGFGLRYLRPLFEQGTHFIAVASAVRDALVDLGCSAERTSILSFGIDTEQFAPADRPPFDDGCTFLLVSGFTAKKGVRTLLRAFARVAREAATARLVLAGDGPERPAAEQLARELGVSDRVEWPGFVSHADLPALYRRCHVFVHPSETTPAGDKEGLPTALMEACACGLPVVATAHAGIPELVTEGANGFLVAERDDAALADRMLRLARNGAQRTALGAAGRTRVVADFNVRTQTGRLEELYDDVIARARDPVGVAV